MAAILVQSAGYIKWPQAIGGNIFVLVLLPCSSENLNCIGGAVFLRSVHNCMIFNCSQTKFVAIILVLSVFFFMRFFA